MVRPIAREKLPTARDASGDCPNPQCGVHVQFIRVFPRAGLRTRFWPEYAVGNTDRDAALGDGLFPFVWRCPACQTTTVTFELREEETTTPLLAWPERRPRELEPKVPDKIRGLFSEASATEHIGAFRAAAAMYRAVVEAICKDRGTSGRGLKEKIKALNTEEGVDTEVIRDLQDARMSGNWSLHTGEEFTAEEIGGLADLIHEAVFEIYVQPAQRAALSASRRAKRKKA
jgi:hypothetical protein